MDLKIAASLTFDAIGPIADSLQLRAAQVVGRTAGAIEMEWKRAMQGPRSGRLYKRGRITSGAKYLAGSGLKSYQTKGGNTRYITGYKVHQASAPGEPAAYDYGHYANSIQVHIRGPLSAEVVAGADYPAYLEYGTSKMAARPTAIPAAEKHRQAFIRDMAAITGQGGFSAAGAVASAWSNWGK